MFTEAEEREEMAAEPKSFWTRDKHGLKVLRIFAPEPDYSREDALSEALQRKVHEQMKKEKP